jgi:predicted  nucleic acid-binding Zn-ribbon protein
MLGVDKQQDQAHMSSTFTTALEKLNSALDHLEAAIDARVARYETQQRDLFSQIDVERDRARDIARELDSVINQIEKTLHPQSVN